MSNRSEPTDAFFSDPRHLGSYPAVVRPTASSPPEELEVNGAPVIEQSHEFVIRKSRPDAQD